jgi:hypothetical protein
MKNYLVFYGGDFYPLGGMFDFKESFDTKKEANDFLEINKEKYCWCHIYDLDLSEIVYKIE